MNAIQQMALHYMEVMPNGLDLLSSDESYFTGTKSICSKVNIVLTTAGFRKRDERLGEVSNLLGRPVSSTKELRVGEAVAIWKGRDMVQKKAGTQ